MKTRSLKLMFAAAAPILFLVGPSCHAQEVPPTPTKTVYTLCGGFCNRSMTIVATFDGIEAACQAAEKLRQTHPYVGILTGKHVNPYLILPTRRSELKPKSCSIVRKSPRCGNWFVDRLPTDLKTAEATVAELRKSKRSAEVIYHLPDE